MDDWDVGCHDVCVKCSKITVHEGLRFLTTACKSTVTQSVH